VRILHLTDRASDRGGADWHLLSVVVALAERGHQQVLAVGREDGSTERPCGIHLVPGLAVTSDQPDVAGPLGDLEASFQPDVIHLHNALGPAAMKWAADRGGVATVQDHRSFCPGRGKLTADGEPCHQRMSQSGCARCFADQTYHQTIHRLTSARLAALKEMGALTVLSHYMKRELEAVGVAPSKTTVIPPFVYGIDGHSKADGPPCVLFAGRLVTAKGVQDAVQAWRQSNLALPLVLAGTGSLRSKVAHIDGVEVLGWVPHQRLSAVMNRAQVVVIPSRWQEPFGIVGLEALSLGKPVAAWRSGGVAEWHPGGELLVEWGDIDALTEALRTGAGQTATPAPDFNRDALVDRLLAVYEGR
jgi:glycosyltransferase involved in cell wall biosynthesis